MRCETCSDGLSELLESYAAFTPAMASVGKTLASPYEKIGLMESVRTIWRLLKLLRTNAA